MPNGSTKTMSFGLLVLGNNTSNLKERKEGKQNKRTHTGHSERHENQHFSSLPARMLQFHTHQDGSWHCGGDANPVVIVPHQMCPSGSHSTLTHLSLSLCRVSFKERGLGTETKKSLPSFLSYFLLLDSFLSSAPLSCTM